MNPITADDYELAEAALAITSDKQIEALRVLRSECGWTARHAVHVLDAIAVMRGTDTILRGPK